MAPNENTIRNLPFFADKAILSIVQVNTDAVVFNAVVHTPQRPYFVKVRNAQRDHYHRVDVRAEFEAIRAAGEAGIGPQAFYCSAEQQCIVMEYLSGAAFDVPTITRAENLPRAARAIRMLHDLPPRGHAYDFMQVIENYLTALDGHPLLVNENVACVRAVLARCRASAHLRRVGLCHGDLAAHNIYDSDGVKFIDLEMAGANDRHFDLATFFLFNGLNTEQEQAFLREYGGDEINMDRLADVRYAVLSRDGLWALSEMASGKVNEVYRPIANYCFEHIAVLM
jgi:thiamine kinase-like enzyme